MSATYEDGVVTEEGVNSRKVATLGGAPEVHHEGGGEDDGEDMSTGILNDIGQGQG